MIVSWAVTYKLQNKLLDQRSFQDKDQHSHKTVLTTYTTTSRLNDVGMEIQLIWSFCQKLCYIIDGPHFYFKFIKGSSSTIKNDGVLQDFFIYDHKCFGHGNESKILWSKLGHHPAIQWSWSWEGKFSILGVVALWGDCMAFHAFSNIFELLPWFEDFLL